jgi:hypothetical protein
MAGNSNFTLFQMVYLLLSTLTHPRFSFERKWWCSTREREEEWREWVGVGRKENRMSKRVQVLELEEDKQGSGMSMGNRKEKEESESGKESGKVWGQNGWKRRVQDNDGMLERKEKEHGEEGEREIVPEERLCQWRSGKIESKRKMDERRPEWKGQRHRQARKKRENQRIQIQQGVWEVYGRGNSGVPGETECKREKNDEIQMWEWGERKQVLDGKRGKKA